MRKVQALLAMTLLIGAAGCPPDGSRFNLIRPSGVTPPNANDNVPVPAKEDLVGYLNNNAAQIPGIQSNDISLTVYSGAIPIQLGGKVCAQGPRNFRMSGSFMGNQEVDLGSNDQEFWFWVPKGSGNYQFFCSYQALEQGRVKQMPFPFQPDWVLEAMGMGKYGPAEKYELAVEKDQLKLIERTKSPQGVAVKKIIVFNRWKAKREDQPQITDFLLVDDASGKLICSAHIVRRQIIKTGGELPREMTLSWPEQNLKLALNLSGVQTTQQLPPQAFVRTRLNGVPAYDLANLRLEATQQAGARGSAWQR